MVDNGPDKCPVSGRPAIAESRMLHKTSEMVYFCCENCPTAFAKKNKFEMKDSKPGKCPISGKDAKEDSVLVVNGEQIFFSRVLRPAAGFFDLNGDYEIVSAPLPSFQVTSRDRR